MAKNTYKRRSTASNLIEKHDKYGFTSLETLSGWHVNKHKSSEFICKKESVLIDIYNKE
ncbi:hypothetical protein [Aliivibrio salmonicida]|uniref:hypothetical protein n=1 Tax=Aliivibrio salmonicida TaxID=40269 RepID=UPI003D12BB87